MEDIFEIYRGLLRPGRETLDLHGNHISPPNAVSALFFLIRDRHHFDPQHLANEGMQHRGRAALLTTDHRTQALGLRGTRFVIEKHTDPLVPIDHHRRSIRDERERQVADIDTVDHASINVIVEHDKTAIVRRGFAQSRPRQGQIASQLQFSKYVPSNDQVIIGSLLTHNAMIVATLQSYQVIFNAFTTQRIRGGAPLVRNGAKGAKEGPSQVAGQRSLSSLNWKAPNRLIPSA